MTGLLLAVLLVPVATATAVASWPGWALASAAVWTAVAALVAVRLLVRQRRATP